MDTGDSEYEDELSIADLIRMLNADDDDGIISNLCQFQIPFVLFFNISNSIDHFRHCFFAGSVHGFNYNI